MEYNTKHPLKCFFAFEGYNSQGMALNRLKETHPDFTWECVGRSEIDKFAIRAADAIFPENKDKNFGDITKIDATALPDFDLFTYSFPCTDISIAGVQKGLSEGTQTRSSLLWECRKIIQAKKPKYLLMENVKALVSQKFIGEYRKWLSELESLGYASFSKVLNAKDYGVPQNRERIFCVSIRIDGERPVYTFPQPRKLEKRLRDILEPKVDEKYYLNEDRISMIQWR